MDKDIGSSGEGGDQVGGRAAAQEAVGPGS